MSLEAFSLMGSIFAVSFLGSWHCGAMCGGFSVTLTQGQTKRLLGYHSGRLVSYAALGALAGQFGEVLLEKSRSSQGLWFVSGTLFAFILALGFLVSLLQVFGWRSPEFKVQKNLDRWTKPLFFWAYKKPFSSWLFGLLTVFLPCGWLYGFLLAAASTGSPRTGALTMALFWLGGIPMLTILPIYFKTAISKASPRLQPALRAVVFLSALFSWGGFYLT